MSTQNIDSQVLSIQDTQALSLQDTQILFPQHTGVEINRTTFVLVMCVILVLLGSLALTLTATWTDNKVQTTTSHAKTHAKKHRTPFPTVPSTPIATSASTSSTVSPITPFPDQLWQEMAVLREQKRFLYYGSPQLPEVALTFDDGPNPYYTPQILAILQQYKIKATFFCIGRQVAEYPDLVKEEYAAGHVIGNHSWSHANMGLLSSDAILTQLNLTSDTIQRTIGVRPTFFRPPYGVFNTSVLTQVNLLGLTTVIWDDEARDWFRPGVTVITSRILGLAGNGAIILLHDGGGDRSQTVAALPTIITSLEQSGFKFVTIQQMVNDLPKNPAPDKAPVFVPTPIPVISPTPTTPALTPTPTPVSKPTPGVSPTPQALAPTSPSVRRRKPSV